VAKVFIDNVHVLKAELPRTVCEVSLQSLALLVMEDLTRGGLADVDHRLAAKMVSSELLTDHLSLPRARVLLLRCLPLPATGRRERRADRVRFVGADAGSRVV